MILKGGGEDVVADSTTPEKLPTKPIDKLPTKPAPTKPADKVPIKKSLKAKKVSSAKARAKDLFKHPRYSETILPLMLRQWCVVFIILVQSKYWEHACVQIEAYVLLNCNYCSPSIHV